jgi:hypothetical protein
MTLPRCTGNGDTARSAAATPRLLADTQQREGLIPIFKTPRPKGRNEGMRFVAHARQAFVKMCKRKRDRIAPRPLARHEWRRDRQIAAGAASDTYRIRLSRYFYDGNGSFAGKHPGPATRPTNRFVLRVTNDAPRQRRVKPPASSACDRTKERNFLDWDYGTSVEPMQQ